MVKHRIDHDPLGLEIDANIQPFDLSKLNRMYEVSKDIKDILREGEKDFEDILPAKEFDAIVRTLASKFADEKEFNVTLYDDIEKSELELGRVKITVIPRIRVPTDVDLEDIRNAIRHDIPFKEGPQELVSKGIVQRVASERFKLDLEKAQEKSRDYDYNEGSTRFGIQRGDALIKIIKPGSIFDSDINKVAQSMAEGIDDRFVPILLERGLDYTIVEMVEVDKARAEKIFESFKKAKNEAVKEIAISKSPLSEEKINNLSDKKMAELLQNYDDDLSHDKLLEIFNKEMAKVDEKYGSGFVELAERFRDTVNIDDLVRGSNVGFRKSGQMVIIDPGSFALGNKGDMDPSGKFLEKIYSTGEAGVKKDIIENRDKRTEALRKGEDVPETNAEGHIRTGSLEEMYDKLQKVEDLLTKMTSEEVAQSVRNRDIISVIDKIPPQLMPLVQKYAKTYDEYIDTVRDTSVQQDIEGYDPNRTVNAEIREMQKSMAFSPEMHRKGTAKVLVDMYVTMLVKELLKKTDFQLKYTVLADQTDVVYKDEMESAVKEVVKHYVNAVDRAIRGAV